MSASAAIIPVDAPSARLIRRILRVNHAGEHGAVSIYQSQIGRAGGRHPDLIDWLGETLGHEKDHRAADPALAALVRDILRDEESHLAYAEERLRAGSLLARLLSPVIAGATEMLIAISTRGDSWRLRRALAGTMPSLGA